MTHGSIMEIGGERKSDVRRRQQVARAPCVK